LAQRLVDSLSTIALFLDRASICRQSFGFIDLVDV
jgi:hypothetical protein